MKKSRLKDENRHAAVTDILKPWVKTRYDFLYLVSLPSDHVARLSAQGCTLEHDSLGDLYVQPISLLSLILVL